MYWIVGVIANLTVRVEYKFKYASPQTPKLSAATAYKFINPVANSEPTVHPNFGLLQVAIRGRRQ